MKTARYFTALSLVTTLALSASSGVTVRIAAGARAASAAGQDQQQMGALQRGYRTGYSDGYQAGWRDSAARAGRDYRSKADYQSADRAYAPAHGSPEDYRDGYQQGFEVGYDNGYGKRVFDSTVPGSLSRRGVLAGGTSGGDTDSGNVVRTGGSGGVRAGESASGTSGRASGSAGTGRTARTIPADTVLLVELQNRLSSDVSQSGDRFEARVIEPPDYEGAEVGGRIVRVTRPGKVRGTAELQLTFDQIRFDGGEWQDFSAQLTQVVSRGGDDSVGEVDAEGGVRGRSSTKEDVAKVGAGAGIGAVIGGIAGGGKGAAIGAILGGGASAGGVMTQRGKEIRLERGQQLMIRVSRRARAN